MYALLQVCRNMVATSSILFIPYVSRVFGQIGDIITIIIIKMALDSDEPCSKLSASSRPQSTDWSYIDSELSSMLFPLVFICLLLLFHIFILFIFLPCQLRSIWNLHMYVFLLLTLSPRLRKIMLLHCIILLYVPQVLLMVFRHTH